MRPREEIENVTQIYSEKLHHYNTNHSNGFEANRLMTLTLTLISAWPKSATWSSSLAVLGSSRLYPTRIFPLTDG